jgi:hypothetical protein
MEFILGTTPCDRIQTNQRQQPKGSTRTHTSFLGCLGDRSCTGTRPGASSRPSRCRWRIGRLLLPPELRDDTDTAATLIGTGGARASLSASSSAGAPTAALVGGTLSGLG